MFSLVAFKKIASAAAKMAAASRKLTGAAPIELAHMFIYVTAIANAVFWPAIGSVMGFFTRRWRNSTLDDHPRIVYHRTANT